MSRILQVGMISHHNILLLSNLWKDTSSTIHLTNGSMIILSPDSIITYNHTPYKISITGILFSDIYWLFPTHSLSYTTFNNSLTPVGSLSIDPTLSVSLLSALSGLDFTVYHYKYSFAYTFNSLSLSLLPSITLPGKFQP